MSSKRTICEFIKKTHHEIYVMQNLFQVAQLNIPLFQDRIVIPTMHTKDLLMLCTLLFNGLDNSA